MSVWWSTEHHVAEHRDLQATSMALDCYGKYCLLAGRRSLAVVDLNEPNTIVKKSSRGGNWDVRSSEWNPFYGSADLFAVACNDVCELIRYRGDLVSIASLGCHTRNISSLNWHRVDANIIATASIDKYINVWDIRDCKRPSFSMSSVAGAGVVKWNRRDSHLVCASYDGDIRLWDTRKPSSPITYIAAHVKLISGLDWSPKEPNVFASSSMDCTVKFFNINSPKKPEVTLTTNLPVWKISFTPYGNGLVTVVVPQLRRGENSLRLWSCKDLSHPIHTFVGHTDVVYDFDWKRPGPLDFQLVTWAKDNTLRIWTLDKNICETLFEGIEGNESVMLAPIPGDGTNLECEGLEAVEEAFEADILNLQPEVVDKPTQRKATKHRSLQDEFTLVNIDIDNVQIEGMDLLERTCRASACNSEYYVCLRLEFPLEYPCNKPPTFLIEEGTTLPDIHKDKLLKNLNHTARQHVKRNHSCLEPCLRQLGAYVENLQGSKETDTPRSYRDRSHLLQANVYGSYQDAKVPFPRTSGARFCGPNLLVCFSRPKTLRKSTTVDVNCTPRALSALGSYLNTNLSYLPYSQSPTQDLPLSVSQYYYQDKKTLKSKRLKSKSESDKRGSSNNILKKTGPVYIFDSMGLTPLNKTLAENYVFLGTDKDTSELCSENAGFAKLVGRRDLVRTWNIASIMTCSYLHSPGISEDTIPIALTPLGRSTVDSLICHYLKLGDIQTVAALCCIFDAKYRIKKDEEAGNEKKKQSGNESPYHTIHPSDTSLQGWNYCPNTKQHRSNSWSEEHGSGLPLLEPQKNIANNHRDNCRLLNPKNKRIYDCYRRAYSDILYRWGLLEARAAVMKFVSSYDKPHKGLELCTVCPKCRSSNNSKECTVCHHYTLLCSLCHTPVKGRFTSCLYCGHGGHMYHMSEWFQEFDECPTGCGCSCRQNNNKILAAYQKANVL